MIIKQNQIWLILLLLNSKVFALNDLTLNKYYNDLCQKEGFFKDSTKVQSFCVNRIYQRPHDAFIFSQRGSQEPQSDQKFSIANTDFYNRVSILVSGGDLRSYSAKTISNHLIFAAFRNMIYFYADVKNFKHRNVILKPQWLKVQLLRDMLRDSFIPETSWIVWVDDDLIFNYNSYHAQSMLDSYISAYGKDASMIITGDTYPWPGFYDAQFNTGVIMVKKNDISRKILSQWWRKRPASEADQDRYIPPNQYGLKLVLEENDFVGSGDLKIAPQRTTWGNLNTFHIFDHWEIHSDNGLAELGDATVQHPGIDLVRKHELIMQTLKVVSDHSFNSNYSLLMSSSCHPDQFISLSPEMLESFLRDCLKFLNR